MAIFLKQGTDEKYIPHKVCPHLIFAFYWVVLLIGKAELFVLYELRNQVRAFCTDNICCKFFLTWSEIHDDNYSPSHGDAWIEYELKWLWSQNDRGCWRGSWLTAIKMTTSTASLIQWRPDVVRNILFHYYTKRGLGKNVRKWSVKIKS